MSRAVPGVRIPSRTVAARSSLAALLSHRMPSRHDAIPVCQRCGWGGQHLVIGPGYHPERFCPGPYSNAEKLAVVRALGVESCQELGCTSFHDAGCIYFEEAVKR